MLTLVVISNLSSSTVTNNAMSFTMDPLPYGFDFMVQPTATYLTIHQVELVFGLLRDEVDLISIPKIVRKKCLGVDITVKEVEAIRDGFFHVSGSCFDMRMSTSGNLIAIAAVDDFFLLLPSFSSLPDVRPYLEEGYGITIDDSDLLDLSDGAFHIAGPPTIEITTGDKVFIPKTWSSEVLWMFEQGCSSEFLSAYAWFKFHAYLPTMESVPWSKALLHHPSLPLLASLKTS